MKKSTADNRLRVLSTKISPQDRTLVEVVATLMGVSVSAVTRELVTRGARDRLRDLARRPIPHERLTRAGPE